MSERIDIPEVDAITVGSIGEPGARVFYLQAWSAGTIHTVKLEKQQVSALGGAIRELLEDVVVNEPPAAMPDLLDPGVPAFVVGAMALTVLDDETGRVTLVLNELVPEEELENAADARLGLSLAQLVALAARCEEAVEGGRPPCPLCGRPMDPQGHVCPKTNGSAKH